MMDLDNNNPHNSQMDPPPLSNLLLENDDEALSREINERNHLPLVYSSPSVGGMTTITTTTTSILNPLAGLISPNSSSSGDTLNHSSSADNTHFVPPPIGVLNTHLVLNNHTSSGVYVGCENPYATPRNRDEQKTEDDDPFGTNNIDIQDDEIDSQPQKSTSNNITEYNARSNHTHRIDDAPGVQYGSHHEVSDSNNISSRVVTTPQKHFIPASHHDVFHDIDLDNPTPSPSTSTQAFFTSNPLYPMASTSDTMSIQQTSPYYKPDPNASPSANRYRPSLDQPLPDIPTLQGLQSNENSVFRAANQPTITIHITEDNGEFVTTVEKRFSNAVIFSVALFCIGLPFLSCFPFLLLFPYRHSNVARVRSLGHVSVVIFNMLCVLNLVLLLCVSVPIFFVLIVNGIVYSGAYKGGD